MDLTPADITAGTPSDTSVVHASQDAQSDNSKSHNERDISRLQPGIHVFTNLKSYKEDDLVWRLKNTFRVQYRANQTVNTGVIATLSTPFTGTITGYVNDEVIDLIGQTSMALDAQGIAVVDTGNLVDVIITSGGSGYILGESLLIVGTESTAFTTALTLADFVNSQWDISDGVGARNVVNVFEEADFGTAVSGQINLENNTEFIVCAPVTISNTLFIDVGFEIMIRSFADEANSLTFLGSDTTDIFATLQTNGLIIGAAVEGGGTRFETNVAHGLIATDFVNVGGVDFDYRIIRGEITNVSDTTHFDITTPFLGDETDGRWNQGAEALEIEEIKIKGDPTPANQNQTLFNVKFAPVDDSELFIFHLVAEDFLVLGTIDCPGRLDMNACSYFNYGLGFNLINCVTLFMESSFFDQPITGNDSDILTVEGGLTLFQNYGSCFFDSPTAGHAFFIPQTTSSDPVLSGVADIHIHNCKDLTVNPSDPTLFDKGPTPFDAWDETVPEMFVVSNGAQKDSMTVGQGFTNGFLVVPDVGAESPVRRQTAVMDDWQGDPLNERFFVDNTTTTSTSGHFDYLGVEEIIVEITYSVNAKQNTGVDQTLIFHLELNADMNILPRSTLTFVTDDTLTQDPKTLAQPIFLTLMPGAFVSLFVNNTTNSSSMDIEAVLTVKKAG